MIIQRITNSRFTNYPVITVEAATLLVIVGIILSGALYPHCGIASVSLLSLTALGLMLAYHRSVILKAPNKISNTSATAKTKVKTGEFSIPQNVKALIKKDIQAIRDGKVTDTIDMLSVGRHRVFTVEDFNYCFRACQSSEAPLLEARRAAYDRAQRIVNDRKLDRTIVIPQTELFQIDDMSILGETDLPILGAVLSLKDTRDLAQIAAERGDRSSFLRAQHPSYSAATEQQITDLAEFIIAWDVSPWNIWKLLNEDRFIVYGPKGKSHAPGVDGIKSITDGLFGSYADPLRTGGLFGMATGFFDGQIPADAEKRSYDLLKIIMKEVYRQGMLDEIASELVHNRSKVWFSSKIAAIKEEFRAESAQP